MDRDSSTELDYILGVEYPVLDKGFIRVIDYMGNQDSVAESARVSYQAGTKTKRDNVGLLRYLMRHNHGSPLEMCEIKFHMKLPISVARQFIRHRTVSVNEMSARYSIIQDEFYVVSPEDIKEQSTTNGQGRGKAVEDPKTCSSIIDQSCKNSFEQYERLLELGVARETARDVLPVSTYTEWYWKCDLRNLLHFLKLRLDEHAQWEIREYAKVIAEIVEVWVPDIYEAAKDFMFEAVTFSKSELDALSEFIWCLEDNERINQVLKGAAKDFIESPSEQKEFIEKIRKLL